MSDQQLNISLLPWQQQVWEDPTRFKIVAAGRRTGKSRLAAWLLIVNALQTDRGTVFYVAPTQGQARDIMWETLMDLGQPVIASSHINNLQIKLVNGATISLKGGDRPETMRGVSLRYLVLDEYADIKPDVWEQILRPALADQKGHALFIGTPMGRNHFYDLYKYAELSDDNTYKAWHFTSYDNPLLDPEEIDTAKKSMSSYSFRQEFMASFEARESQLFKEEWLKFSEETPSGLEYYITVDPAGFEDVGTTNTKSRLDNTAICVNGVNQAGDWFIEDIIYGRWDLAETARRIFDAVAHYKPTKVGIEKGIAQQAIMSPLQDLMKRRNRYFRVEMLSHGNKKKTDRVVWALQGRFEHKRITLKVGDWNSRFLDELFQFPSKLTHDDLVDALAYQDQIVDVAYASAMDAMDDDWSPLDDMTGF